MEWTTSLRSAIAYMEEHLNDNIAIEDVANHVHMSSFYLQKGFKLMTGYSLGEYIRNRRLYLAALDLVAGKEKVINIAYRYGYDTPESFSKAFSRFHGVSPMQVKGNTRNIQTFLPLKIKISIQGGNDMDYVVEKMSGFKVIGFEREFQFESGYENIPKFWDEFCIKYMQPMMQNGKPSNEVEQVITDCCIGEFGVCIDDIGKDGKFRYLIAGTYKGGAVPEGMATYEFPDMDWAKFRCVGPMPGSLQSVNTKVFQEWLPGNTEYKIAMGCNIEWYSNGDTKAADYESGIWVPVVKA